MSEFDKSNYVKVNGLKFSEYYWETSGHFWCECMSSDTYNTEEDAKKEAKTYCEREYVRFVDAR